MGSSCPGMRCLLSLVERLRHQVTFQKGTCLAGSGMRLLPISLGWLSEVEAGLPFLSLYMVQSAGSNINLFTFTFTFTSFLSSFGPTSFNRIRYQAVASAVSNGLHTFTATRNHRHLLLTSTGAHHNAFGGASPVFHAVSAELLQFATTAKSFIRPF